MTATRPGERSLYAYFAKKGTRKQLKIPAELDVGILGEKLQNALLQQGIDYFVDSADYINFIYKDIAPALSEYDKVVTEDQINSHAAQLPPSEADAFEDEKPNADLAVDAVDDKAEGSIDTGITDNGP